MRTRTLSSASGGEVTVPTFFYGTAWKEEQTAELTKLALGAGFVAIDTACQRKHYHEAGVGEGIAASAVDRGAIFLQTKFTYRRGQDHRLPYDPEAPLQDQVAQSFATSLENLRCDSIDSYVLHGPSRRFGLDEGDWEVWRAMEALCSAGKTKLIGVSNVGLDQIELLYGKSEVKPSFVQNRCFARDGWDRQVRAFCRERGIAYQGFSLLTANRHELASPKMKSMAERHGRTIAQLVFRFALQVDMIPLTGTTDPAHMREDLAVYDFALSDEDVVTIENVGIALTADTLLS